MSLLTRATKRIFLDWSHPFYSKSLYEFSKRYVDMWYGDNNFDRKTNGEYRILSTIIPKSQVVFDVGANIGEYAAEILSHNPKVQIHAFEPDPDSFAKLSTLPIQANNFALGETPGTHTLYRMPRSAHNSFYSQAQNVEEIPVEIRTLDTYVKEKGVTHIDFLKIDVEGHEFFVLKGGTDTLKAGIIDYIQFEFSGSTADARVFLKDFIALLNEYSYDLYRIRGTDVQLVEYFPDRERFTLTNYLAIRKGMPIP